MLDEYRQALRESLTFIAGREPPYFPLSFRPRSIAARDMLEGDQRWLIDNVVLRGRHTALIGPPGCGKSRALRQVTFNLLNADVTPIPIYVPLRHCPSIHDFRSKTWADALVAPINYFLSESAFALKDGKDLIRLLGGRSFVLLLDGLNELSQRSIRPLLDSLADVSDWCSVVVASRVREYPAERQDYHVFQVNPLEFPSEVKAFLEQARTHFSLHQSELQQVLDVCDANAVLRNLATNPYILVQLCRGAKLHVDSFPEDRTALLEIISRQMISTAKLAVEPAERFLGLLAHKMHFEQRALAIPIDAARQCTVDDDVAADQLVPSLIEARLLLRQAKPKRVTSPARSEWLEFSHQVFQEFFAGLHLARPVVSPAPSASSLRALVRRNRRAVWTWDSLSIAFSFVARAEPQIALDESAWLASKSPHLSALILSEIPIPKDWAFRLRLEELTQSTIKHLEGSVRFWAFTVPHLYKWVPFVLMTTAALAVYRALPQMGFAANVVSQSPAIWAAIAVTLAILVPIVYFRMLRFLYHYLDGSIFDRFVSRPLTSLEIMRFRGGDEALAKLKHAARYNAYMGNRMRSWIDSTITVGIASSQEIGTTFVILDEDGRVIECVMGTPNGEELQRLFDRLANDASNVGERRRIVQWLTAILRGLGPDDPVRRDLLQRLRHQLAHEKSRRIRRMLKLVTEDPPSPRSTYRRSRISVGIGALTVAVLWLVILIRNRSSTTTPIGAFAAGLGTLGTPLLVMQFIRWMLNREQTR